MQDKEEDPSFKTVLLSTFIIKKKRCRVYFHKGTLIWETERTPYTRWTLPLTDVLTATYGKQQMLSLPISDSFKEKEKKSVATSSSSPTITLNLSTSFVLHYAARGAKNKWSHHSVTMSHDDHRQITSWVKTIHNYLANFTHRPRKILLFINPFGGKKKRTTNLGKTGSTTNEHCRC